MEATVNTNTEIEIFFGFHSDGKEGGSDGKEGSKDGGHEHIDAYPVNSFLVDQIDYKF